MIQVLRFIAAVLARNLLFGPFFLLQRWIDRLDESEDVGLAIFERGDQDDATEAEVLGLAEQLHDYNEARKAGLLTDDGAEWMPYVAQSPMVRVRYRARHADDQTAIDIAGYVGDHRAPYWMSDEKRTALWTTTERFDFKFDEYVGEEFGIELAEHGPSERVRVRQPLRYEEITHVA